MLVSGFLLGTTQLLGQYFPLIYGSEEYVSPVETIELLNGEFLSAIGVSTEVDGDTQFGTQLLKFNEEGAIIDVIVLTVDSITPTALKLCSDGSSLLICHKTINDLEDIRFPIVYKLTEAGTVIWVKEYPFRIDFDANDLVVLEGDEFIFSATDGDSPIVDYDVLVRCNQDGDTLWTREYIEFEDEYAKRLRLDTDGNVLVVGDARLGFSPDERGYLRKVNGSGETLWRRLHLIPDSSVEFRDVLPLNGEYILVGNVEYSTGYVRHIDSDGELIASRFLGIEEFSYLTSIDIRESEQIVISGRIDSDDGNGNDVYFCTLQEAGLEIETEESYGGSEDETGSRCFVTSDEQVLISARSRSFNIENNREAYYLLVDSIGQIITSISDNPSSPGELRVFPNPSTHGVPAYFTVPIHIDFIMVHDSSGRVVWQSEPNKNSPIGKHPLPIDELDAGVYLLVVGDSHQRTSRSFIVQ